MKINDANIDLAYRGFKTVFQEAFDGAPSYKDTVAMVVKSETSEENYAWLGQFPGLREWFGDRVLKRLSSHGFKITNRKFESTVTIKRDDFEDDRYGTYRPLFSEMGRVAKQHPDRLIFDLLQSGYQTACYDGEPFFSESHPASGEPRVRDPQTNLYVEVPTISNVFSPSRGGPAWYLIDASRAVKPIIWQERTPYDMESMTDPKTYPVFMRDEFLFGIRARVNCGFGLWQLACSSKEDLSNASFAAARAAMMGFVGNDGQLLGITPTHLIVPPSLEIAARNILSAGVNPVWKDAATLVVSPYLK